MCTKSIALPPSGCCCSSLCLHYSLLYPNSSFRISLFWMQSTVFLSFKLFLVTVIVLPYYLSTWRTVVVWVYWRDFGSRSRSLSFSTLVAGPSAFPPLLSAEKIPFPYMSVEARTSMYVLDRLWKYWSPRRNVILLPSCRKPAECYYSVVKIRLQPLWCLT